MKSLLGRRWKWRRSDDQYNDDTWCCRRDGRDNAARHCVSLDIVKAVVVKQTDKERRRQTKTCQHWFQLIVVRLFITRQLFSHLPDNTHTVLFNCCFHYLGLVKLQRRDQENVCSCACWGVTGEGAQPPSSLLFYFGAYKVPVSGECFPLWRASPS